MSEQIGIPRRGRAIVEPMNEEEFATRSGVVAPGGTEDQSVLRVKVLALGDPPMQNGVELPWEFGVGAEVLVPFYCGRHYQYYTPEGRLRDIWLVVDPEIIHVLSSRPEKAGGRQ